MPEPSSTRLSENPNATQYADMVLTPERRKMILDMMNHRLTEILEEIVTLSYRVGVIDGRKVKKAEEEENAQGERPVRD